MKIAISATGEGLTAQVDPRFGRARFLVVFDSETGSVETLANTQNLNAVQGAGIQTASLVEKTGAKAVLTGHCGPKAFRALQAGGIAVFVGCEGTVEAVIERWRAGELTASERPDVQGHWA